MCLFAFSFWHFRFILFYDSDSHASFFKSFFKSAVTRGRRPMDSRSTWFKFSDEIARSYFVLSPFLPYCSTFDPPLPLLLFLKGSRKAEGRGPCLRSKPEEGAREDAQTWMGDRRWWFGRSHIWVFSAEWSWMSIFLLVLLINHYENDSDGDAGEEDEKDDT